MVTDEDEDSRSLLRSLTLGVGALLVASLVIGGVIGVVTLGAVHFTGVTDGPTRQGEPSLFIPEPSRTPEGSASAATPAGPASASPEGQTQDARKGEKRKRQNRRNRQRISLSASPNQVAPMGRIDLTGRYRGQDGATLQVQRFDGGWDDFPTSATVRGGTFSTYVMTGRAGVNRFRVIDPSTGRSSNPVRVRVG